MPVRLLSSTPSCSWWPFPYHLHVSQIAKSRWLPEILRFFHGNSHLYDQQFPALWKNQFFLPLLLLLQMCRRHLAGWVHTCTSRSLKFVMLLYEFRRFPCSWDGFIFLWCVPYPEKCPSFALDFTHTHMLFAWKSEDTVLVLTLHKRLSLVWSVSIYFLLSLLWIPLIKEDILQQLDLSHPCVFDLDWFLRFGELQLSSF